MTYIRKTFKKEYLTFAPQHALSWYDITIRPTTDFVSVDAEGQTMIESFRPEKEEDAQYWSLYIVRPKSNYEVFIADVPTKEHAQTLKGLIENLANNKWITEPAEPDVEACRVCGSINPKELHEPCLQICMPCYEALMRN